MTTALLSETGPAATSGLQQLVVPKKPAAFEAVGAFGVVYERYKCYACHRFNGYGGTLAPDLSYEGSLAQKKWIYDFLKNPQTVRPALILRMPQFNMTDKEATILAEYLSLAVQKPGVNPESVDAKAFTPAMVADGKQLYQGKYQCQSCHTIGNTGGYVGPNLNNAGNWLTAAWIEAWLRDPQALQPGTIEPRRELPRRRGDRPDGVLDDTASGNRNRGRSGKEPRFGERADEGRNEANGLPDFVGDCDSCGGDHRRMQNKIGAG